MMCRTERPMLLLGALAVSSCAPLTDEVFTSVTLRPSAPLVVVEGAGVVEVPLHLAAPPKQPFALTYRLVGVEAQNDCQLPDFEAAEGRVEWAAGATEAAARVWIGDDDLAELDERLELWLESPNSSGAAPAGRVEIVIADDERAALLDARQLGVIPGVAGDQSAALQKALDHAAGLGRAVLVMVPGDYEIASVSLPLGITLSARDVRWHRPPMSAAEIVSLRLEHQSSEPSAPSLVEGLMIDGRREAQGPYREHERQDAHLIALRGDPEQGGSVRATFEQVELVSGTGSGLLIGPNSEANVCRLRASELWRDALTLNGGAAVLRVHGLDATATRGTGLWLAAREPGYEGSYRIDVEAQDVQIGAGDLEIEVSESSRVNLRRLTMTEPPFRLDAPGGSVRIAESVLMVGVPSAQHNRWVLPHDVEITDTTIVVSEKSDGDDAQEGAHAFAAVSLASGSWAPGSASPDAGRLTFIGCRFERAGDFELDDTVHAIANPGVDTAVRVQASALGSGFAGWFAAECVGCALAP